MKYTLIALMAFLITGLLNTESHASSSKSYSYYQLAQAGSQSLDAAVQAIKQKTGGRILSAKTEQQGNQRVYKIKVLLPSGRVQTFTISAQ